MLLGDLAFFGARGTWAQLDGNDIVNWCNSEIRLAGVMDTDVEEEEVEVVVSGDERPGGDPSGAWDGQTV